MSAQSLQQVQKQTQALVLAPQLRQSLKILQAPALDLRNAIIEELQNNPALEELPLPGVSLEAQQPEPDAADNRDELNFKENYQVLQQLDAAVDQRAATRLEFAVERPEQVALLRSQVEVLGDQGLTLRRDLRLDQFDGVAFGLGLCRHCEDDEQGGDAQAGKQCFEFHLFSLLVGEHGEGSRAGDACPTEITGWGSRQRCHEIRYRRSDVLR